MIDKSGREILPGDLVVYGHALGRCAGLQYAKVLKIHPYKETWRGDGQEKIRVQGVNVNDNDLGVTLSAKQLEHQKYLLEHYPAGKWRGAPSLIKPSTLSFSSRILKITRDQVPPDVLALLDTVEV